jgi:subtilisin family serine protease
MKRLFLATGFAGLLLSGASLAGTLHPSVSDRLATLGADEQVSVIAFLAERADIPRLSADLRARRVTREIRHQEVVLALREAASRQTALVLRLQELEDEAKVAGHTPYWITNAVVFRGTAAAVREIAGRTDVDLVTLNFRAELIRPVGGQAGSTESRGLGSATPGLRAIQADRVWNELGITGAGRLVANLDTGVDGNHPALASRWRGVNGGTVAESWLDVLGGSPSFPTDNNSHGTHVMGTITGLGVATGDSIGVAFGAQWIACNAINQGAGSELDNDVYAAYEWFADPDGNPFTVDDVPDVVQNSWRINEGFGYPDCATIWWDAIDNCEAAGVVTTWSAGNEGPGAETIGSPADRITTPLNTFSVGAVDATSFGFPYPVAGFSSRGPSGCDGVTIKPEIMGPGVDVRSSVPGGGYAQSGWSGTSMAGPHVAGVVALMREANPDIEVADVKQIMLDTAVDLGATGEDNNYGHGIVNAYEAVLAASFGGTLAGTVRHSGTSDPIPGATINVVEAGRSFQSILDGTYQGLVPAGTYTVSATHPAFVSSSVSGVSVVESATTVQDFSLAPNPLDGLAPVISSVTQPCGTDDTAGPYTIVASIADNLQYVVADLHYRVGSGSFTTIAMTQTGAETFTADIPGHPLGSIVQFYVEARDAIGNTATDPVSAPAVTRTISIVSPIAVFTDDVELDLGWALSATGDDATTGRWQRANPQGTFEGSVPAQPEDDHTPSGVTCFVTEAAAGTGVGSFDVDNGCTTLLSPVFDLSGSVEGRVRYWRWFYDGGSVPNNDELEVSISNDGGTSWTPIEILDRTANAWTQVAISLCSVIEPTANMRLRVFVCDDPNDSVCEAAIDDITFEKFPGDVVAVDGTTIASGPPTRIDAVRPNPFNPLTHITYSLSEKGPASLRVFDVNGREVRTLLQGVQAPGRFTLAWDGTNDGGLPLGSGIYFVRLDASGATFQTQVTLLK